MTLRAAAYPGGRLYFLQFQSPHLHNWCSDYHRERPRSMRQDRIVSNLGCPSSGRKWPHFAPRASAKTVSGARIMRQAEFDPEPPFNPAHTQRHLSTYSGRTWLSLVSLLLTRLLGRRQRRFIAQPITAPHLCDDFAILRIAIQPGRQRKVTGK
jgi:hypothetical protein